jgi:hypothetical protein
MKKALVVLLILAVAGGLFGQTLSKTITADFETDLFYLKTQHKGQEQKNLLTSGNFDGTELRLVINYKSEHFSAYIRLNADNLLQRNRPTTTTPSEGNGSFSAKNARPIDLLYKTFDDYGLTGTAGMWEAYFGTQAKQGLVNRFQQGYDDFLGIKHDNYGIFGSDRLVIGSPSVSPDDSTKQRIPAGNVTVTSAGWDVNNFIQKSPHGYTTAPIVALWADLKDYAPILIGVAGSLNDPAATADASQKANVALRVSGNKIADLVTFDAIYKYRTEADVGGTSSSDTSTHTFGLYANILALDALGIGIGYSGSVKTAVYDPPDQDPAVLATDPDKTAKATYPFYSGIDLRVKYTLERLNFTLNNNVSFASAEGDKHDSVYGFKGTVSGTPEVFSLTVLGEKESEKYFALYNALAVEFKPTDTLTLKFLLGNELVKYSYENSSDAPTGWTADITKDVLQTALLASFALNPAVTFRAGLDVRNTFTKIDGTTTVTGASWETTKLGTLEFGIPVGIKIVF